MDRDELHERIDEIRREHPGREEFVAAVRGFAETIDPDSRKLLGEALLEREPETGGFEVIDEGGWLRRTMRRIEERGGRR